MNVRAWFPRRRTAAAAPLWVRGLTAGGRPVVLGVALLMCAPGEYHLARIAGWSDPFAYGMPVVLSAYAGIAAAVASTRRKGDRGRWSAIVGAGLALALAVAAQIVSHLISTSHIPADQPSLIAATSLVPPAVVGHLLHLAATPPDAGDTPAPAAVPSVPPGVPANTGGPGGNEVPAPPPGGGGDDEQDAPDDEQDTGDDDQDTNPPSVLVTSSEVAARCGVDPSTVRSWVANGRLDVVRKDDRGRNLFALDALPEAVSR